MTFQINRSMINALAFDYAEEVEKFRQEKLSHRFTLDPAPKAADIIEYAIRRVQFPIEDEKPDDFVADFEIVEDVVPPTPAERKAELVNQLRQAEREAMVAVISPARERLLALDLGDIVIAEGEEPSAEQAALMARRTQIGASRKAIQRYFANLEAEVEDLTEASIEGWTFKPFGG